VRLGPLRIHLGINEPVAKLDLTLREVAEADSYGLSPDKYDELRSKLEERLKKKVTPEVEKVKAEWIDHLRKEVTKELTPKIRVEVLAECRKQAETELRDGVWKELNANLNSRAPTPREREAFKEFVREAELDCLTQANAASGDSDRAALAYRWSRRVRLPFSWGLFLAAPVLAFFLHRSYEWGLGFWAFILPLIAGAIGFAYYTSERHDKLEPHQALFGKVASDYWVLAERAKKLQLVTAHTALNRGELQTALTDFTAAKKELDDRYLPSARSLEKSRGEVRAQLLTEVDPEKVFRVASDTEAFDKLEEKSEEAEQQASRAG
jgi:hypothetical protein